MGADLEHALKLADTADAIASAHFRSGLPIETKPDLTPVTEADRAVETALRGILAEHRAVHRTITERVVQQSPAVTPPEASADG